MLGRGLVVKRKGMELKKEKRERKEGSGRKRSWRLWGEDFY